MHALAMLLHRYHHRTPRVIANIQSIGLSRYFGYPQLQHQNAKHAFKGGQNDRFIPESVNLPCQHSVTYAPLVAT